MSFSFSIPEHVVVGTSALDEASEYIRKLGSRAFIVSDPAMVRYGNTSKVERLLDSMGIKHSVFDGITGEPTDTMINEGLAGYTFSQSDFLIAIGGGSAIDAMKAIGALASNGGEISDYMGKTIEKAPPMVAIPTTAGTGSEATQFTIINDTSRDIKMLLKGHLMPTLAIIDPQFTISMPDSITASTGLDAFTHAAEAYTSVKASSLSDVFALSAIKRIAENLPIAYQNGSNTRAREEMALAAFEAGVAFNNSSVTVVHGMSRPIGALFHIPHGISNAMLDVKCFEYVLDGAYDRFADLARAVGAADSSSDDETAAHAFLDFTKELCRICKIPSLEEYEIDRKTFSEHMKKMAFDAMASGSPSNTRKHLTENDLLKIYESLWE